MQALFFGRREIIGLMKKILFLYLLFLGTLVMADQKPYIISGFDDVLRQAENTGLIKASLKILEDDKGFSGMPELYHLISDQETSPQFVLVSAISNWFDTRISKFLVNSKFPSHQRYLRNWLTEWSIESFKIEKIKAILTEKGDRQFIVIFDNSEASLNLVEEINRQFPKKFVGIYLRQVQNKKLPLGATGFYTAFDIAAKEYEQGRLSMEDVTKVAEVILNQHDIDLIIPAYAMCPSNDNPCGVSDFDIKAICAKVHGHVEALCRH